MKLLLDTHVWLWAVLTPERIAATARQAIEDPHNTLLISAASAWEIAVKHAIGKLPLPEKPELLVPRVIAALEAIELPVTSRHAISSAALPYHHRDPFDRLLVAQALCEGAALVTVDELLTRYGATVLWAGS
ncbi:type II toxin-antitoxin system VapC family toxin [Sorangium atrum]|uniref:Type II toxin-antitoxin system VapC family toxin n=1 Tax=Sorangium atrum TaxID=2995308 RepID=A0ABT5BU40_9BACT|nr:type II toxin-antitoxin system VapC family toxin [Sorangium aterium]MDC0677675.1 type II toxin-antitoxin system VapC family toxin [Sorangium aterium]